MLGSTTKMAICNEDVLARDRFVCLDTLRYQQRCPILVSNVINFLDPPLISRNLRPGSCIQYILACEEFIWLSFIGQYKRADYRMQIADWV